MKKILTTILAAFVGIITCIHPVKINADLDNHYEYSIAVRENTSL